MNKITPLLFLPLATRRRRREIQRWGLQHRLYLRLPSIPLDRSHDNRLCSAIRACSRAEGSIPRRRSEASRPLRASPAERFRSGGGGRNGAGSLSDATFHSCDDHDGRKREGADFRFITESINFQLLDLEHRRKYSLSNFLLFQKVWAGVFMFPLLANPDFRIVFFFSNFLYFSM